MFLLGGLCFVLLEWIGKSKRSFLMQMLLGMETITALELLSGILLNRVLGLTNWDYSPSFWGRFALATVFCGSQ